MSETPRTDAKEKETEYGSDEAHAHYGWKFARALERELATVTRERDEARQAFASFDALFRGVRQMRDEAMKERDDIIAERDALRAELEALQPGIDHLRETCESLELERDDIIAERDALRAEVERLTSAKDGAYEERNRCVALIARMALSLGCRAGLARTAIEGWSEDWHGCVYIDLPTGQVSWHYHDSHGHLFEGLPKYAAPWDGHDTPEKYRRVGDAREFPRTAWVENQFRQINDWCCYATEEDIAARLMALQQIGVLARAALTPAEEPKT